MSDAHPFKDRRGRAARDGFAASLFVAQRGRCAMCPTQVDATLRGRAGDRAAVVDHVRPWRLRPDLAFAASNLQLICRACHDVCARIERQHWPDDDQIARAKRLGRGIGVDGWPV